MHKFLNTTHRNVAWIKAAYDREEIDTKPPFQRNPVWSVNQKSSLIETILLGYPIPEIYMQEITDETGRSKHIIVDGQQRIRSVVDFIHGDYEIDEEIAHYGGFEFEDLAIEDRKKIFEYNFVVRLLPDIPDAELRTIFQRLNKNVMSLNQQELRHATYWGPFIRTMEEICELEYWGDFNVFSANDRRRMLDVEFVSELAVAFLNGFQNKKKKLEEFYQMYETNFEDRDKVMTVFLKILGEISILLPEIHKTRWRKKSDFYTLFLYFTNIESHIPLSSDQRTKYNDNLIEFSRRVDAFIKDGVLIEDGTEEWITLYSDNVERAASDLGSRKNRHQALNSFLITR